MYNTCIGKQDIALRGHRVELDDSKPGNNPSNFLCILTEVAHYDPVLQEYLEEPFRKDVTCGMLSISADEVTSSNDEILSICVRCLDEFQNLR